MFVPWRFIRSGADREAGFPQIKIIRVLYNWSSLVTIEVRKLYMGLIENFILDYGKMLCRF